MEQVLNLGHFPRDRTEEEAKLARQIREARKGGLFDTTQLAQLEAVQARKANSQTLVDQVLNLGYLPREYRKEEAILARQVRDARKRLWFDARQLAQLEELQNQRMHPNTEQQAAALLEEAHAEPSPMYSFADEAETLILVAATKASLKSHNLGWITAQTPPS